MALKRASQLGLIVIFVAWCFDFLFWKKVIGISFPIFVAITLAGGLFFLFREGERPALLSLILLLPIGFFAVLSAIRLEPLTRMLDFALTLGLMALFAITCLGGRWLLYGPVDYLWGVFRLVVSTFSRGIILLPRRSPGSAESNGEPSSSQRTGERIIPVLRGLAIALPIVVLFAALLASADLVFSRYLHDVLNYFDLGRLPEYIWRAFYIFLLAYLLAGVYLHALFASHDRKLIGYEQPLLPAFMGTTEAAIVLGGVDLLFAAFVAVQFRYFFGGETNIHIDGFTYAEYARRGFAELVIVALFSLLLFLALSAIVNRKTPSQQRWFSGLGLALVTLVVVILTSAFERLLLYEQAYGFTRLRTYTHDFMIWLGLLLLVLMGLELFKKLRFFWLAAVIAALGFGLTVNLMNVDGFIARHNVTRALAGEAFDAAYLSRLSPDAIPTLIEYHRAGLLPEKLNAELGGSLACLNGQLMEEKARSWQSFHLSRQIAEQWLSGYQTELEAYPLVEDEIGDLYVNVNGQEIYCSRSVVD